MKIAGLPPLRRNENSYSNRLHTSSPGNYYRWPVPRAIWARVEATRAQPFDPLNVLALERSAASKKPGLSNAKIRTLKALANAVQSRGSIDLRALVRSAARGVWCESRLMTVHGIGPWTADIYVMFCLGRTDGFAPGDVALANAVGLLKKS